MIPDNVEKIIMTKEDYDRNVEQLLLEKINAEQEIERLNNLLKETGQTLSEQTTKAITLKSENERLNNIINELEEYMIGKDIYKILLYKLRDLKESDKVE